MELEGGGHKGGWMRIAIPEGEIIRLRLLQMMQDNPPLMCADLQMIAEEKPTVLSSGWARMTNPIAVCIASNNNAAWMLLC